MCVCMYVCIYVFMYVCMYVCIIWYACIFVCMYVCMYVCVYVCMYIRNMWCFIGHTHTHTHREREREREKEIHTHTHTHIHTYISNCLDTKANTFVFNKLSVAVATAVADRDRVSQWVPQSIFDQVSNDIHGRDYAVRVGTRLYETFKERNRPDSRENGGNSTSHE